LSTRLGIVDSFYDLTGARRDTRDGTREAICAAMGHDASTEESAARSIASLEAAGRARPIEPVQVWRQHAGLAPGLLVRRPRGQEPGSPALSVHVELRHENGDVQTREAPLSWPLGGDRVRIPLPSCPGPGYHRVRLHWAGGGQSGRAEQLLAVAPRAAFGPREALGADDRPGRAFGIWTNLYTLRSRRDGAGNWGVGDLGDLERLARLCAEWGGDFVGLSPLHAIPGRADAVSPYSPTSRLYRSVLYLDVEAVPELAESPAARAHLGNSQVRRDLARLRESPTIEYEDVLALKLDALRELHAFFAARHRGRGDDRDRAYARYRDREGQALLDFATFEVLEETLAGRDSEGGPRGDWRRWPEPYRDVRGVAVARFREQHAAAVDFRCWLQFELDRQLGLAAAAGREAGLRIGLYPDLAVGSGPDSADTWMSPEVFATGIRVGAPPDAFAAGGQDWGVAPLDPHRLRRDAHRFFVRLLRSSFRHAGALRIDHVMGLERLFWIPEGRPPEEGAYVRYPRDELLGLLALESRRHGSIVIGEDLGTVPQGLSRELASWGVLSSAVLAFERDDDGFRPASHISPRALASANTHDLAPLVGWISGRDLALRRGAGETPDPDAYAAARAARDAECAAWLQRLRLEGVMPREGEPQAADWCRATSAFLARTPAPLVSISLDDLAGEEEPVHLPGIGADRHPGWRRRMRACLEDLAARPEVRAGLPPVTLGRPRAVEDRIDCTPSPSSRSL
jgi:4-alpha-glucanotransferase